MSFMDNNPFNRPSPNFASNLNTFNTYSNYGNNARSSSYGYGSSGGNYFGTATTSQSYDYKYSRQVQDSPFISNTNPFSTSKAIIDPLSSNPFTISSANYNTRPSYTSYQATSEYNKGYGWLQAKQQKYFVQDKYDDKFRKSNFQKDVQIELGKSRQRQLDTKYMSRVQAQDTNINKILQNNPFQKGSLKNNYTNSKYPSTTVGSQYLGKYSKVNNYTNSSQQYSSYEPAISYDNKPPAYGTFAQNKYSHLEYKPNNYFTTSNVNPVPGFDQVQPQIPTSYKVDQLYFNQNIDKVSQKDSRNTLINRFDDVISEDKYSQTNRIPRMSKNSSKEAIQTNIEDYTQKLKNIKNPFERDSNIFVKNFKSSSNRYSSPSSQFSNQNKSMTGLDMNKMNLNEKVTFEGLRNPSSNSGSIKFDDFNDIRKTDPASVNSDNLRKTDPSANNANTNQSKYDNLIFKRSSKEDNLFSSQKIQNLLSSKKSKPSYNQKVQEQFQLWERESRSSRTFEYQNPEPLDHIYKGKDEGRKIESVLPSPGYSQKNLQSKESMSSMGMKSSKNVQQGSGPKNYFSFMKQSLQKSESGQKAYDDGQNFFEKYETKKSLTQYQHPMQSRHQQSSQQQHKNKIEFQFSGENFTDSEPQDLIKNTNDLLQRISQVNEEVSEVNFSKRNSRVSVTQTNTEQRIDEKLQGLRYKYEKKDDVGKGDVRNIEIQQVRQSIKMTKEQPYDFIDISFDQQQRIINNQTHNFPKKNDINQQYQKNRQTISSVSSNSLSNTSPKKPNLKQRIQQSLKSNPEPQIPLKSQQVHQSKHYEFQPLEEFQKQYQFQMMKGSGFDFQEDEFQETQRKLEIQDGFEESPVKFDKIKRNFGQERVLDALDGDQIQMGKYGRGEEENKKSNNMSPAFKNPNNQIEQSLQEDNHVPSFHSPAIRQVTSAINLKQKKLNIQQKVEKMKIYESSEGEGYRSSMEFMQEKIVKIQEKLKSKKRMIESDDEQDEDDNGYYKSPFQKKENQRNRREKQEQTVPSIKSNTLGHNQSKQRQSTNQHKSSSHLTHPSIPNQQQIISQSQVQNLKQTKKHPYWQPPYQQQTQSSPSFKQQKPVRDSFEFNPQPHKRKQIKFIEDSTQFKDRNMSKSPPLTLQIKGNIYHLIKFV